MDGSNWMTWNEISWLQRSHPAAALIRLADRLLRIDDPQELVTETAGEFGVPICQLVVREQDWTVLASRGDLHPPVSSPLLNSILDRDAALWTQESGEPVILVPTPSQAQHILVLAGPRLGSDLLPEALLIGRVLGRRLDQLAAVGGAQRHVDRLRATLELARSFAGEKDTQRLLERIAEEAARLLGSDRASIFIWDREQRQLVACPALGVDGGRLFLPDNKGIVGDVIHSRKPIIVDDAYNDPRFDQSVDKKSGYKTRNLLCVPLFDADENCIGVFELINKFI